MCWNCNNKKSAKETFLSKLKGLESQKGSSCHNCHCNKQEEQAYEQCEEGSCQESYQDLDEHLDELRELLDNSKTAISQIQDMVEEIEETLDDIKEAIGQSEQDLEEAEEIIDNLR
ncbi:MAG: hypothetical protein K2X90_02450 [Candidatus Babeliaceae bacterium]|nr:hypothetical protein [Candidatus Babeliaceae bacterium]